MKIKARKDAVVKVENQQTLTGKKTVITVHPDGGFTLSLGGVPIARCEYAKRLSDWAFDQGAFEVRHDYHLGLSDQEP